MFDMRMIFEVDNFLEFARPLRQYLNILCSSCCCCVHMVAVAIQITDLKKRVAKSQINLPRIAIRIYVSQLYLE